jgi:hypothetical protein
VPQIVSPTDEVWRLIVLGVNPVIYCADIGSVPNGRFGWARVGPEEAELEAHRGSAQITELVDAITDDIDAGRPIALGFECPLFVPVPKEPLRLGTARPGEGNRSWSAGAGSGALATGIVEVAWLLSELRRRWLDARAFLDWADFAAAGNGLFLWEAFVTDRAKATTHVDDAAVAVAAFRDALPDPRIANAVDAERPLSLLGSALVWSGWSDDLKLLRTPCLVIKAAAPAAAEAEQAAAESAATTLPDPTLAPRAHRDRREVERKQGRLDEPHIAPLSDFVRRLRARRGPDSVPWFDPTEAGVEAPLLFLFENPGRRADVTHGSGFISADNDDPSADNAWHLYKEAGIDRRRDMVAWNIVPWYLGDERTIGKVGMRDLDEARPALHEVLDLLPRLRVVVLFGRVAQRGWDRARPPCVAAVLRAPHTSGRWLNAHPEDRIKIVDTLAEARRLAGLA